MDTNSFLDKLDGMDYGDVQHNVDFGLYSSRKRDIAKIWLERNAPVVQQQPNVLVIVAPKSKVLKWLFNKLGIGQDKTNLIEHDGS